MAPYHAGAARRITYLFQSFLLPCTQMFIDAALLVLVCHVLNVPVKLADLERLILSRTCVVQCPPKMHQIHWLD